MKATKPSGILAFLVSGIAFAMLAIACSDEAPGRHDPVVPGGIPKPVTGPPSGTGTPVSDPSGSAPPSSSGVACKEGNVPGVACPGGAGHIAQCHDAAYTDCSYATSAGATYACVDCSNCTDAYDQALAWCKTQH